MGLLGQGTWIGAAYPLLGTVVAYLWPILESCRAVVERDEDAYHQWLTYWMVLFVIRLVEGVVDLFMSRLPLYREVKLVFITWLVLPRFKGASIIYHGLIHKYLEKHEEDIDDHIVKITHHAKKAAWDVSATVVKETSGVVARAASRLVLSPSGMSLIQAAALVQSTAALHRRSGSLDEQAHHPPPPALSRNRVASASLPGPVRDGGWVGSDGPVAPEGLSRRTMSSPVGATPSQLLAMVTSHLDDGIFVHILFHHHQQPGGARGGGQLDVLPTAPALHLLRLSATRRALVYDDVGAPQLHTLPLLQVLAVRSGPSADAIDLLRQAASPAPARRRGDAAQAGHQPPSGQQQHERMTIVVGGGLDRDSLLAGLRLMLSKVREPYIRGARPVGRLLQRRALRQWRRRAVQQQQEQEEAVLLGDGGYK